MTEEKDYYIEKLIELNEKLGIELITIDVTKYICGVIKLMTYKGFKTFPNREFSFEYEGAIGLKGHGIWNAVGDPLVTKIGFSHDLKYSDSVKMLPTKCIFDYDVVQNCINANICINLVGD